MKKKIGKGTDFLLSRPIVKVAPPKMDAKGCSDDSTLHLKRETQEEKGLWNDYSSQAYLRRKVHNAQDPGVKTLPGTAYMVFHEVLQAYPTLLPNVRMSIWNDEEFFRS